MQPQAPKHCSGVWKAEPAADTLEPFRIIDVGSRLDKDSILGALAASLHFPSYFGHNWDAAWDCLSDMDWQKNQSGAFRLDISKECTVDENALSTLLELFAEASELWHKQGRNLTLLVVTDRNDLQCIHQLPDWNKT